MLQFRKTGKKAERDKFLDCCRSSLNKSVSSLDIKVAILMSLKGSF